MEVKLHDIGEGMTEADINCFLVKPGDIVKADDPLVEVQTDKMTAEIPAPKAGIVREFTVELGQTISVGTTLLILEAPNEEAIRSLEVGRKKVEDEVKKEIDDFYYFDVAPFEKQKKRILASPYTRKIARDNSVDIEKIEGSGPAGRILDSDIYSVIASTNNKKILQTHVNTQIEKATIETDTLPFRGRRKQIAKKMVHSLYTIPHCTHFEEVDVTDLIQFREELKKMNKSISATAFFLKALSICLNDYPIFNARLDEENERIQLQREHHIGIAIDTEEGLIVPVIQNIEKKSVQTIHSEMKQLTEKAKENKLMLKDISGGTFTISNVGPLGGSFGATPIIQHPEVALVSFHKTKKMPVVTEEDKIVIRSIMNISMSFDHRVADGATAVRFTNRFIHLIQNPKMMLLELV